MLFRDGTISRYAHQPEAVSNHDDVIVADVIVVQIVGVKQSAWERDLALVACTPAVDRVINMNNYSSLPINFDNYEFLVKVK